MSFRIHVEEGAGEVRVVADGDIDFKARDAFRTATERACKGETPRVVIDLDHASFCDSSALAVLAFAHRLTADRDTELVVRPGPADPLIRLSGMTDILGLET